MVWVRLTRSKSKDSGHRGNRQAERAEEGNRLYLVTRSTNSLAPPGPRRGAVATALASPPPYANLPHRQHGSWSLSASASAGTATVAAVLVVVAVPHAIHTLCPPRCPHRRRVP